MLELKRIKLKKIKEYVAKLPRISGEHQFITALIFIFLALILGSLIFYKYGILIERKKPEISESPLYFNEKVFQEILKIWQEREKKFEEADLKVFPDPFRMRID